MLSVSDARTGPLSSLLMTGWGFSKQRNKHLQNKWISSLVDYHSLRIHRTTQEGLSRKTQTCMLVSKYVQPSLQACYRILD